jgi:hypothetical protein
VIKPSSSEVQEIARLTTDAIKRDIQSLKLPSGDENILTEFDIIQLKIEQVLTETIRGFERELVAVPPTLDKRHYPEQSPE